MDMDILYHISNSDLSELNAQVNTMPSEINNLASENSKVSIPLPNGLRIVRCGYLRILNIVGWSTTAKVDNEVVSRLPSIDKPITFCDTNLSSWQSGQQNARAWVATDDPETGAAGAGLYLFTNAAVSGGLTGQIVYYSATFVEPSI